MLLDRTHRTWLIVSLVVLAVATGAYVVHTMEAPNGPHGGSVPGLMFGIAGTALMVFAGLLAARKQVPSWRLGSAQFWVRGHIWLGMLSVPLVLFHAGFGWGGPLERLLWITFGLVLLSGLFGLAVQQVLPRYLTSRVSLETFVEQIPYQCRAMQFLADKLIAEHCGPLDVDGKPLVEVAELVAKQRKWLTRDSDFPKMMAAIYAQSPVSVPEKRQPIKGTRDGEKGTKKASDPSSLVPPPSTADRPPVASAVTEAKPPETVPPPHVVETIKELLRTKYDVAEKPAAQIAANAGSVSQPEQPGSEIREWRVSCPNCGYELNLPDPSFLGRLARCPGCREKFALEASAVIPVLAAKPIGQPGLSKLDRARSQGAAATSQSGPQSGQPNSKLELTRSQGGPTQPAGKADTSSTAEPADKPLSPLERARAQGAAQRQEATPATPDKPKAGQPKSDKPMSKIERARAQAAAKRTSDTSTTPSPPSKPAVARKTPTTKAPPKGKLPVRKKGEQAPARPLPRADQLKMFYLESVRPFLALRRRRLSLPRSARKEGETDGWRLDDETVADRAFALMRATLPSALHPALAQLEDDCRQRRQFTLLRRVHHWLHWWLLVHIPMSIALFVLLAAHVVMALRVVPFTF